MGASHVWLVAEGDDGSVLGYAYGGQHRTRAAYDRTVEVSAYVDREAVRQGIGRALYQELFERLRSRGFRLAVAGITLPNDTSVGFHEALGFRPVGTFHNIGHKFDEWHDVGWWQLDLLRSDVEFVERGMRRWIELVDARDIDGLEAYVDEFYAPDAWIDFGTRTPDALPGQGVQVLLEWARMAFAEWSAEGLEPRYELIEVIEAPGGIVAPARSLVRMHGHEFETHFTFLFVVRDGKVERLTMYATREEALEAATNVTPE